MKIADIFRHDLDREIKEVIKVDDAAKEHVFDEIREYVVTEHIHEAFAEVLDQYEESIQKPTEVVNCWISGFFGSGKSSFAKILGYILANPNLGSANAAQLFTRKLAKPQVAALLNTIHSRAPTFSVFVDLSSARNVAREGESVVLPLYRELLTRLDYARNIELAELEITLEGDGRLDMFRQHFREATGYRWRDRRDKALALSEASRALHVLEPQTYPAADSYARTRPTTEVSANWFAKRAQELLSRRRSKVERIAFIVDEVGQYVSRSVHRMLDLQGLAHACQKEDGRLWLVATGQETLEDVVGALGDKRVELARVRDRFPITIDLIPSDIEEVVSRRVLEKSEGGTAAVRQTYEAHENQVRTNVMLESPTRRDDFTGDEFVAVYPLLPYQIQLFIDAVSALRAHGGAGPMVGGANRTLIRLAHQLVKSTMREKRVGALTTVPMAYDLMDEMIPGPWRAEIDQVTDRHGRGSIPVLVAKTIALVSGVRALPMHDRNLAALIHPATHAESCRSAVGEALGDLMTEETLRQGENGYRLQSPDEKDWEKKRRSRELKTGDFNRLLRITHLPEMLRGLVASAKREFRIRVTYDGDKLLDGDLILNILEGGDDQMKRATRRSRESAHQDQVFLVFERSERTWRFAEEVFRSAQMLREGEHSPVDRGSTELLHEERKRLERLTRKFEGVLESDMLHGALVFRGTHRSLDGKDLRPALSKALASHVSAIYPRLGEFAAPVRRSDAVSILRADDLSGLPSSLGPEGLGVITIDSGGYRINDDGPVSELVKVVRDRAEYGSEPSGGYLESYFQRPPYGADLDVVRILTAAAVRAGLIRIGHAGAWLGTADIRVEGVFQSIPKFRSAVFHVREDGPSVEVRARVAKMLHHDLVGERPGHATEELAEFARARLEPDREVVERIAATLQGVALTLPESVRRARGLLARMATEDDETLVASLDAGRADLKDGVLAARELVKYLDGAPLDVLRKAKEILSGSAKKLSDTGRRAWETGSEILRTAAYVRRFPELRAAVDTIQAEWIQVWTSARERLAKVVADVREQAGPLLDQVGEGTRNEFEARIAALDPAPDPSSKDAPTTDALRARVGQAYKLFDELREELGRRHGKVVRKVRASDLFTEPVRDEDQLEALLNRVQTAAEEALRDGEYFLLV